jgi:hypothetical protein
MNDEYARNSDGHEQPGDHPTSIEVAADFSCKRRLMNMAMPSRSKIAFRGVMLSRYG